MSPFGLRNTTCYAMIDKIQVEYEFCSEAKNLTEARKQAKKYNYPNYLGKGYIYKIDDTIQSYSGIPKKEYYFFN